MSDAYTGGCACGAIRYEISAEPLLANHCQCLDCQHKSGTGHGSYLTFPSRNAVRLSGEAKHWDMVGDSGNVKSRGFCPACGSPVYLTFAAMPELFTVMLRALTIPPFQAANRDVRRARLRLGSARSGPAEIRQNAAGMKGGLSWQAEEIARVMNGRHLACDLMSGGALRAPATDAHARDPR